jgi:germination protein M
MRKIICIITVFIMISTMITGCGIFQKLGLQKSSDELTPVSSVVMNEEEAKKLSDKIPVYLYFANEDNTKLKLEVKYIPMSEAKKSSSSLATAIVKELINGPAEDSKLKATIPAGTQLRSPVKIEAGIATVDFNKAFVEKHPGGKAAEQMTLFSIVNSLTEMKDIQKVKFTIEGSTKKEFKGSFKFDAPFPRSASLISKEPDTSSAISTDQPSKDDGQKKDEDRVKEPSDDAKETSGISIDEEGIIETDLELIDEYEILE